MYPIKITPSPNTIKPQVIQQEAIPYSKSKLYISFPMLFLRRAFFKSEPRFYNETQVLIEKSFSKKYNGPEEIHRSLFTYDCGGLDKASPFAGGLRVPQNKVLQKHHPGLAQLNTRNIYCSQLISSTYFVKNQISIKTSVHLCSKPSINKMESIQGKVQLN